MATTTRKRKKRQPRKAEVLTGRDAYRARDQDGNGLADPVTLKPITPSNHPDIVLTKVQRFAERTPEENTYYVERQSLFGPAVDVYAVQRDEDGVVSTFTLSQED